MSGLGQLLRPGCVQDCGRCAGCPPVARPPHRLETRLRTVAQQLRGGVAPGDEIALARELEDVAAKVWAIQVRR